MDRETLLKTLENIRANLDPENEFTVELKSNKRRSLNANSYMWVLCEKIAKVTNTTREDIYRETIRQVGVYDDVAVASKASDRLVSGWNEKGIGWFAESFGESKVNGADRIRLYYGSSIYDTPEMARLIDLIVMTAKDLGIETLTPDELERLKNSWKNE